MKKSFSVIVIISLAGILLWQTLVPDGNIYIISTAVILLSMIPFFLSFLKKKTSSGEIALVATLTALAVVSRAVFYLVPQVKPIAAVVIVSAVCLGAERGYIIGALSAFISNFIFGQGIWTPFQMVGLALVGFTAGLIFHRKRSHKPWQLALWGFVLASVLYGVIVDTGTVMMAVTEWNIKQILSIYAMGIVFDLTFGASTAVFLFIFGKDMIKKINRIVVKYGIIDREINSGVINNG